MKAEAILNKISEDATKASSKLLDEAKTKVIQMQRDSINKFAKMEQDTQKKAEIEANEIRKQMQSMADLEFKKEMLKEKRVLIDESFLMASEKLKELPVEQIRVKILSMILEQAEGDQEIYIGENAENWFNNEVFININNKLNEIGKAPLKLQTNRIKNCTGAVLSKDGIETNCTLEAILNYIRSDIENLVADKLFQI